MRHEAEARGSEGEDDEQALLLKPAPALGVHFHEAGGALPGPKRAEEAAPAMPGCEQRPEEVEEGEDPRLVASATAKLNRRLLAMYIGVVVFNYLDRTNLSFGALQFKEWLGMSDKQYGMASSVFFIGYFVSQLPSNLVLRRLGAPLWLGILVVAWGLVAAAFAFVKTIWQVYLLRLLCGLLEGGAFPGMYVHFTDFFLDTELGFQFGVLLASVSVAQIASAPLAAGLLAMDGVAGVQGWQWLFLTEGVATMVLGCCLFRGVPRDLHAARFLTRQERQAMLGRLKRQEARKRSAGVSDRGWDAVLDLRTWHIIAAGALQACAFFAVIYFLPLIIQTSAGGGSEGEGPSDGRVALLSALPFTWGAAATVLVTWNCKRTGEQRLHACLPFFVTSACFALLPLSLGDGRSGDSSTGGAGGGGGGGSTAACLALLAGSMTMGASRAVYGAWPAMYLQGEAVAVGVATMNSVANLGGLVGPLAMGAMHQATGGYGSALLAMAAATFAAGLLIAVFPIPATGAALPLPLPLPLSPLPNDSDPARQLATAGGGGGGGSRAGSSRGGVLQVAAQRALGTVRDVLALQGGGRGRYQRLSEEEGRIPNGGGGSAASCGELLELGEARRPEGALAR